jgi:ribonucleoside-diphosphate reductase beta chain
MRLWHKAKKLGVWDPRDIDLTRDAEDWARLDAPEQDLLLRLTSLFQAGEESVTLELLPLILVIAEEGRLEEEMFLASFLWEEAKHVESFRRFFDEVAHDRSDLSRYHTPNYRRIFYDALPTAMNRLRTDRSPVAQAEASVTYNMIVEGVLAETGYRAYDALLQRNGIMPGMQQVVGHLRRDEARHIAYGVYLLSRLVAEHGDPVWDAIRRRLDALLAPALGVVAEAFQAYDVMPFGLQIQEFTEFALKQFQARVARLERARTQDTAALDREAFSDLDDSV